jgi:hypothetical protein
MTLRQAGLAGLVSPQAAAAGVVNARLGRVILGGAAVDTLDMYGDGLIALNVTRQVTRVQVGKHQVAALVTNGGTVLAAAGVVPLSAEAADAVVGRLVAGAARRGGRVVASGVGGDVEVETAAPVAEAAEPIRTEKRAALSHPSQTPRLHLRKSSARHARQLDETGTLTVADSCTGITDCLSFSAFLDAGSTIVDSNGAIVFAPGTLGPSQTLASNSAIVLTTTLGAHSTASGNIIFENGLNVFAPGFTITASGSVLLNGVLANGVSTAATAVQVTAGGDITEHMPSGAQLGSINAVALMVSAGGSVALDNTANAIGTLSGATVPNGSFTFADSNGLSVTAPIAAGGTVSVAVSGAGNGLISTAAISGTSVALSAASLDIGGAVDTPELAAQATAGSAELTSGANMIGSIGTVGTVAGLRATAGIMLADGESLSLDSAVSSSNQIVAINLTGAASSLTGTGGIGAQELDLSASGSIAVSGAVTATLLTADARGGIALTSAANSISTLGTDAAFSGLAAGGNVTVADAATLALNAPVSAPGQMVAVAVSGAGNALSGTGAITGSAVALSAGGSIALSGTVAAGTLAASAGEGITLSSAANAVLSIGAVGTLAGVRAGGDIALDGGTALTLDGGIVSTGGTLMVTLAGSASNLTGTGGIAGTDVALSIGGSIAVSGTVSATVLAAAAGGGIAFTAANNVIGGIGTTGPLSGLAANGAVTLDDASTLTIAAPVVATGGDIIIGVTGAGDSLNTSASITGNAITVSAAAGLALGASVDAGTFGLALAGGTGGVAASGALIAGTLAVSAGGNILLSAQGNSITTIGSAGGLSGLLGQSITLADAMGLTMADGASATASGGAVSMTIAGGSLILAGSIVATSGLAALSVTGGDITETGSGLIQAGTLTAVAAAAAAPGDARQLAGGAITLGRANTITALGDSSAAGVFMLADGAVTILPTASVSGASGVTLSLGGATVTQEAGSLLASSRGAVTVNGGLTQLGGTLTAFGAATITGGVAQSAGGSIAGETVAVSGAALSQVGSSITGTDGVSVTVSLSVSQAGASAIRGGTIAVMAASLSQNDSVIAGGPGGVSIGLTGDLAQNAGGDIAGLGNVRLTSSQGTLYLAGTAASASTGTITLDAADGLITESAASGTTATGTISAGALTGRSGLATVLETPSGASAGNQIASVDGFTAGAGFSLVDGPALSVLGTLAASGVSLRVPALTVTGEIEAAAGGTISLAADAYSVAGSISAPGGLVALGLLHEGAFTVAPGGTIDGDSLGQIVAAGGTIALGTTNGVAADGNTGLTGGGTWAAGSSGFVTSLTTGALSLTANAAALGLFSAGPVEVDGVLSVGTLYGAAGGNFLAGSANAVTDIGRLGLMAGGSLGLADGTGLMLDAGGGGGTTQLSGVSGVTLTLTGQTLTQGSDSSISSGAGAVMVDATLLLQDAQATLTAATNVALTGAVTQLGQDSIMAQNGNFASGSVQQDGGGLIQAVGNVTIAGSATQTASMIAARQNVTVDDALTQSGGTLSAGMDATLNAGLSGTGIVLTQSDGSVVTAGYMATVDGAVSQQASSLIGTSFVVVGGGLAQSGQGSVSGIAVTIEGSVAQSDASSIGGAVVSIGEAAQAGTLSQTGGSSINALAALQVTLTGGLTQDQTSALISPLGAVSVRSSGGDLVIAGTVSAPRGQVLLTTLDGTITQAAAGEAASGTLQAASLYAAAGGGDLLLTSSGANSFGTIAVATATGTANLADTVNASLAAQGVIAGTQGVTLSLGDTSLTQGSLSAIDSAGGMVVITAWGLTQQGSASVSAENGFSLSGNLTQLGTDNVTAMTGLLAIGGDATQGGRSVLAAPGGGLTIGGSLTQVVSTASALFDVATGGAVTQAGGTITAGQDVLIGTLAGAGGIAGALLAQSSGGEIAAVGSVTVLGGAMQDGSAITGSSAATILGGLTQSDGSALTGGAVSIGTGMLPAALTQDQSVITATRGNVVVTLTGNLAQSATGSIVSQAGSIVLQSGGGTLFLAGQDDAARGLVDLVAANGDITEAAQNGGAASGDIEALGLAAQAGTLGGAAHAVLLDRAGGNAVTTLTGVDGGATSGASGLFALTDQTPLTLAAGVTVTGDAGLSLVLAPSLQLTQGATSAVVSPASVQIVASTVVQDQGAEIAGAGGVSISGDLIQTGLDSVISTGGAIAMGGGVTQAASSIAASAGGVSIGGTLNQSAGLVESGQSVSIGGQLYPGGTAATVLTQGGSSAVSAGGRVAIGGGVVQDASFVATGGALVIDGSVAQENGSALAGTSVTIGGGGLAATLSQATSRITASQGDLAISLSGDLTQDSMSLLVSPSGGLSIVSAGGGIYLGGTVSAPAGTMTLSAPLGAVTETALGASSATGTLLAGTLSAQAGSGAAFALLLDTAGANRIGTIATASATGTLDIADGASLTLAASGAIAGDQAVILSLPGQTLTQDAGGRISSAGGAVGIDASLLSQADQASIVAATGFGLTGSLVQQGGTIDALSGPVGIGGAVSQTQGAVIAAGTGAIGIGGGLTQSGSTVSAAGDVAVAAGVTQAGSSLTAGGLVVMAGGGALVQSAGSLLSGDAGVALTLAGGLAQDSSSTIQSANGNVTIVALSGDIDFAGRIAAGPAGTTTLVAAQGTILGATGTLQTDVLAGRAAGAIDLAGLGNQIAAIAGPAPGVGGLSAGGTLQLNDSAALLVQDSTVSGTQGAVLALAGGLTESGGSTIESLNGGLAIESPGVLRFAGTLAAPQILLGNLESPKRIVWTDGTILTGSAIPVPEPGIVPDIANPVLAGSRFFVKGLFATAGGFQQSGTTVVGGLDGARQQTLAFTLTGSGGTIAFDPRTGFGLAAPHAQLLLDLQHSGRATGNIDAAGLNVFYYGTTPDGGGGSSLTGSVDGRKGSSAAASGFVHSLPGVNYALNNCPIESLSCVLLSPVIVPVRNPVQDVAVSVARRHQDDDDLILPNVGEQDY